MVQRIRMVLRVGITRTHSQMEPNPGNGIAYIQKAMMMMISLRARCVVYVVVVIGGGETICKSHVSIYGVASRQCVLREYQSHFHRSLARVTHTFHITHQVSFSHIFTYILLIAMRLEYYEIYLL